MQITKLKNCHLKAWLLVTDFLNIHTPSVFSFTIAEDKTRQSNNETRVLYAVKIFTFYSDFRIISCYKLVFSEYIINRKDGVFVTVSC